MRFISRIDSNHIHCWTVRVNKPGVAITHATFSDSKHGGMSKALSAAVKLRDKLIKKHKIKPNQKLGYKVNHSQSWSGIVGVTLVSTCSTIGNDNYAWLARYQVGAGNKRRQSCQSFAINKYGYQEAFRLAVVVRCNKTGQSLPKTIKAPRKPKYVY